MVTIAAGLAVVGAKVLIVGFATWDALTLPSKAKTGKIAVTTPGGTARSALTLKVS